MSVFFLEFTICFHYKNFFLTSKYKKYKTYLNKLVSSKWILSTSHQMVFHDLTKTIYSIADELTT